MKKLYIILALIICLAVTVKLHENSTQQTEWLENRQVVTVTVPAGVGIDYYGSQYAPEWMDLREYRTQIMQLNGMDSAMLYAGQTLQIYA